MRTEWRNWVTPAERIVKMSKPSMDPCCDQCRDYKVASTTKVLVSQHCNWQYLCDKHAAEYVLIETKK